jgi:hypothetical protein
VGTHNCLFCNPTAFTAQQNYNPTSVMEEPSYWAEDVGSSETSHTAYQKSQSTIVPFLFFRFRSGWLPPLKLWSLKLSKKYFKTTPYLTENSLRLYNKQKCETCRLKEVGIYSYHCALKGRTYLSKFSKTRGNVIFLTSFNYLGRLNEGRGRGGGRKIGVILDATRTRTEWSNGVRRQPIALQIMTPN